MKGYGKGEAPFPPGGGVSNQPGETLQGPPPLECLLSGSTPVFLRGGAPGYFVRLCALPDVMVYTFMACLCEELSESDVGTEGFG